MKEQIENNRKEYDIWPGRYFVCAKVKEIFERGSVTRVVYFVFSQMKMVEDEVISHLKPFGITPDDKDWFSIVTYVEDTFSAAQANELIAYLKAFIGIDAYMEPAYTPVSKYGEGICGVSAFPYGGNEGFFELSDDPGYNLSIKVMGFYRISYQFHGIKRIFKFILDHYHFLLYQFSKVIPKKKKAFDDDTPIDELFF